MERMSDQKKHNTKRKLENSLLRFGSSKEERKNRIRKYRADIGYWNKAAIAKEPVGKTEFFILRFRKVRRRKQPDGNELKKKAHNV